LAFQASAAPSNAGYYMQPAVHGETVIFVSQGDLWRVPLSGGTAHSLTSHIAPASHPAISPDGKWVAFSGTYEGPSDVYVMPVDGDLPTRLTFDGGMTVVGWTPDGKVLAATRFYAMLPDLQLVEIDPKTRKQKLEPLHQASDGAFDPTGKTLFFTRLPFQGSETKRYQGGLVQQLWSYTDGEAEAKPLTKSFAGTSKAPMVWQGRVYFLSDRDGTMNVWSMNSTGGDLKQHTHSAGWDIQSASLDAGKIVYQVKADLHVLDLVTGSDKTIDIGLAGDFDQSRDEWVRNPAQYVSGVDLSADGSKIALTARGKVFVAPVEPGRFVTLTRTSSFRYRDALFSPDGKWIFALSDQSGEQEWWKLPANGVGDPIQITRDSKVLSVNGAVSPDGSKLAFANKNQELWIADTATGKMTQAIASQDGEPSGLRWSPDSKWLAFVASTPTFDRVAVYSVKTGQTKMVTTDRSDAESPTWSPDGKWLYFLSNRTFRSSVGSPWGPRQPEPYFDKQTKIYMLGLQKGLRSPFQPMDELFAAPEAKPPTGSVSVDIDFDQIQSRLWEAPAPAGNYSTLFANGQRLYVSSRTDGGLVVQSLDFTNKSPSLKTVAAGFSGFQLSADGKKLLLQRGGEYFVVDANGSPANLEKPVDLSAWTLMINPRQEWKEMFADAWRLHRDFFYDQHMNGVDWKAMYAKYSPLVDRVRDRSELANLTAQMVGELSALHTFVYGGDNRTSRDHIDPSYLGAVLTRDDQAHGYRIDRVYQGEPDYPNSLAPLSRPGVDAAVGDVVESVDGVDLMSVPDISAPLRNKAGKQVLVRLKEKETGKEREAIVTPMSLGAFNDLKYTDWEISRRQRVETESHGDIGYVHLRAMGSDDINQWERDFYPNLTKSGLIIDVRHNGGGNIDSWVIEKLLRKAWFFWQSRVGNPTWNMQWAFRGHVVVLCDERTASDGEAFTEGIKRLNIGKVIGTRTWGGEIWLSSDNVLEDGGIASAAETGVYGPEGKWLVEGHGVDPDIVVDNLPHSSFMGKDAQLAAALQYLTREIQEKPVKVPSHPSYPDKTFPPKPHTQK
jgi:tricorn protease